MANPQFPDVYDTDIVTLVPADVPLEAEHFSESFIVGDFPSPTSGFIKSAGVLFYVAPGGTGIVEKPSGGLYLFHQNPEVPTNSPSLSFDAFSKLSGLILFPEELWIQKTDEGAWGFRESELPFPKSDKLYACWYNDTTLINEIAGHLEVLQVKFAYIRC